MSLNGARAAIVVACAFALVASSNDTVNAQCDFDTAAKTRPISLSLVRAHAPCDGVHTFPSPNTQTQAGVPACAAPTPINDADWCEAPNDCSVGSTGYTFGPTGSCKVTVDGGVASPCPTLPELSECFSLRAKLSCKDILDGNGDPAQSPGASTLDWALSSVWRITDDDGNGSATIVDWPAVAGFSADAGRLSDKVELLSVDGVAFSPCAQAELIVMRLMAPDGNIFATPGSAGLPPD